ncbi:MAG: class I poly(R)-hydroxyalkanoic acid synthase [Phenylobacterium sp.]|uniref:class I poly(R)-hydroxyalkanoic acid synthase n=1 Tax=Phenylobacterium sp. TaxID=1871053 RepID=UPI00121B2B05|nr:class I poly(R)-hydroxyalkanoic acid synthase [Phenylobacterium sp.]TAL29670.1 MAG: class I poly(R)-hydroxyalkanoic acid synthase [Phenylobacterium sp.]
MSEQTAPSKKGAKKTGAKKAAKADKTAKAAAPESKTFKDAPPQPQPPPSSAGPAPAGFPGAGFAPPGFDPATFTADQRAQIEQLSMNLAKAAITAQGAIAEMALRQADRPAALSPDPFHVGPALTQVMSRLAAQPDRMMRAQADLFSRYLDLWQSTARRASGETPDPIVSPAKGDKRFNDPDWSDNPVFDVIKQSYLLTANFLNGMVAEVDGVDPLEKRRVEFFMKMLTDAFSPSNFLASNPTALREVMSTGGASLVKGMENFQADLQRGGGSLSIAQTDYDMFKIGENVATAPGKVIFRNEIIELLQFSPSTDEVYEIPLLIFPPWINKFYIMDLRPENSLIRWLASQGFTVLVASWVNPDATLATKTFEDYMRQGIYEGVAATLKQTGVDHVNTVGYCIGGTLLSATLAHMAAKGDTSIGSATFFAAQQDFSEAGDLLLFTNEDWLKDLEQKMDEGGGVLSGQTMADTFNALRGNDLIWSFFVNNYLLGKEPKPFDLLFWNSDQTRMPKTLHTFYLRRFYGENAMAKGELTLDGVQIDLSKVKIPIYVQSSKEDHIAPARSVFKGARLFGGPTTFTMAGSGHIAGVINAPVANKYQHWTNDKLPATLEEWQAGAVETPGSWWPHWAKWLAAKSGKKIPARDPAKGPLPPLGDAPGTYVKVKS